MTTTTNTNARSFNFAQPQVCFALWALCGFCTAIICCEDKKPGNPATAQRAPTGVSEMKSMGAAIGKLVT